MAQNIIEGHIYKVNISNIDGAGNHRFDEVVVYDENMKNNEVMCVFINGIAKGRHISLWCSRVRENVLLSQDDFDKFMGITD